MNTAITPSTSCLASLASSPAAVRRSSVYRKSHPVRAIALLMCFISAGTEFWAGFRGINQPIYPLWYLVGTTYVVAYLATILACARVPQVIDVM